MKRRTILPNDPEYQKVQHSVESRTDANAIAEARKRDRASSQRIRDANLADAHDILQHQFNCEREAQQLLAEPPAELEAFKAFLAEKYPLTGICLLQALQAQIRERKIHVNQ